MEEQEVTLKGILATVTVMFCIVAIPSLMTVQLPTFHSTPQLSYFVPSDSTSVQPSDPIVWPTWAGGGGGREPLHV